MVQVALGICFGLLRGFIKFIKLMSSSVDVKSVSVHKSTKKNYFVLNKKVLLNFP